MEKQAEARGIWREALPEQEIAQEKPVLVKAENQWNHEDEIQARGQWEEQENHREKVHRLVPGMDLKRWIY